MRRKTAKPQRKRVKRSPTDPLVETIVKKKRERRSFTELEKKQIFKIRGELLKTGLNDSQIAREIQKRIGRKHNSIVCAITRCIQRGEIPINPNKIKDFSDREVNLILRERKRLMVKGVSDKEIGMRISKRMKRTAPSVIGKISRLVKEGRIPHNPNTFRKFSEKEIKRIISRANELMKRGLVDWHIADILSKEMKKSKNSLDGKIKKLRREGKIKKNPNKKSLVRFSREDITYIIRRRSDFIAKGLSDIEIARKIHSEKGFQIKTLRAKFREIVNRGKCEQNPHNKRVNGFFSKMTEEKLEDFVKKMISKYDIKTKSDLRKRDSTLYKELVERKIIGKIKFERQRVTHNLKKLTDSQLLWRARKSMREKGIETRSQFSKIDHGLYKELKRRGLVSKLKLQVIFKWASMSDEQLLQCARKLMKEKKIEYKKDLEEADGRLVQILRERKIYDRLPFKSDHILWKNMSDKEILDIAIETIKREKITEEREVYKRHRSLFGILQRRNLLQKLKLRRVRITWKNYSESQLVDYAKGYVCDNSIRGRTHLLNTNVSLYGALLRRRLLAAVFAEIEKSKKDSNQNEIQSGLTQAADAMEQFGGQG
jgi:hypothetical protein